jgi:hypothetical protein
MYEGMCIYMLAFSLRLMHTYLEDMCMRVCVCVYVCVCIYIYIYIYTYIHTHIHLIFSSDALIR